MFSNRPATKVLNQNLSRTLPITCQICLCKVKDPVVCPNLHTFCSFCIDVWLEKSKQCPTCRVPITQEQPCRRILGGVENLDDADMLKPSDFSHANIRKARYLSFFQQYEEEIARLLMYVDSVNLELAKIKESSKYSSTSMVEVSSANPDLMYTLKGKLQQSLTALNETTIERDNLKEVNKKLDSENSILMQDTIRLKLIINEKTSQMSSKYTVAALETKIEGYEKEIKQLQKALEKSDTYIAELEHPEPSNKTLNSRTQNQKENHHHHQNANLNSDSFHIHSKLQFKPNDARNVKFAEKTDLIPTAANPPPLNKQITITKDNFYGSPSKNSPSKSTNPPIIGINKTISSFSDRLKNTNDLFSDDSTTKLSISNKSNHNSHNPLLTNVDKSISLSNAQTQSFLFSPMKRLRLDEIVLERPDETVATLGNNTMSSSADTMDANMTTPPRNNPTTPPRNNNSAVRQGLKLTESENSHAHFNTSSTEFSDCLKLLNQAEKKVQNRISPSNTLPEKYFQKSNENANFINPNTATYNTLNTNNTAGATMSYSGSQVSSMNSMMNFVSNSTTQFQGDNTAALVNGNNDMVQNYGYQQMTHNQVPVRGFASPDRSLTYHQMQSVSQVHPVNELGKMNDFKRTSEGINNV